MQKYGNEEVFTFRKSLSFVRILDEEVYIYIWYILRRCDKLNIKMKPSPFFL